MSVVHVLPVGDLIKHEEEGDGCPCGVTSEPVKDPETGAVGWLITHHSLDGRERHEANSTP
jgi:hypothetical protein